MDVKDEKNFKKYIKTKEYCFNYINLMTNPLVSIIMNCNNGRFFLKRFENIFSQSYENWELIFGIINQMTKVKKFSIILKIRIKYFIQMNLIHYINQEIYCKKVNGKFITFLDTDDIWNKKLENRSVL